ncbi:alpha/beta fold hydrolase [Thermocatellispora tengchongensis]|uniref:alpha/beta fold hydrolase n=1 Tax=Thermocatellispora tengchongensis TaxID=1073253 RepID=UPI00362D1CAD
MIALEQRGHGHSDSDGDFSRDAYIADAAAFAHHLGLGPITVLGHSMGGVTAFQLAARHPGLVRALIVEEGGAVNQPPRWPTRSWTYAAGPAAPPPWPNCAARSKPTASPTPATSWKARWNTPTGGASCSTTTT